MSTPRSGSSSKAPTIQSLRKQYPHKFKSPKLDPSVVLLPGAHVLGDVEIGADSSIWFNAVVRGDVNDIKIGARTNVQDCSVLHVSYHGSGLRIGNDVTIGHGVILHACTIADHVLIGMGSQVLDDADIGEFVLLGAGSLVTQGVKIPSYSKALGRPAKVVGKLTDKEIEQIRWSAPHYVQLSKAYSLHVSL